MGVVMYALICYGLTAVISLLLVAIILGVNRAAGGVARTRNSDRQG